MSQTKNAIVTGGSKGLGKELILLLAKSGYSVATISRSKDELDKLKSEVSSKYHTEIITFLGDLAKQEDILSFCNSVQSKFSTVDVIINNAGFNSQKTSTELTEVSEIERQFTVHTVAPFLIYKTLISAMKTQKSGYVINILTDQVRERTRGGWAAYATTKHALYGLGKVMMAEAAEYDIKVTNAVIGGMNSTFRKEERSEYLNPSSVAQTLLKLLDTPKEVFIPEIVIYPKIYLIK